MNTKDRLPGHPYLLSIYIDLLFNSQWLLSYFNDEDDLWINELDFVEAMHAQDVRNNSAWHHRFFVVWGCGVRDGEQDRARVLRREIMCVLRDL